MAARSDRELKGTRRGAGHAQGRIRRHAKTRGPEAVCEVNATRRQVPASAASRPTRSLRPAKPAGPFFCTLTGLIWLPRSRPQPAVGFWVRALYHVTCADLNFLTSG